MLTCYRTRRRIGAYLDQALDERLARATAVHLEGCPRCRREAGELTRLRALLVKTVASVREPDWSGFWQGIVRGVEDARHRAAREVPARRSWWRQPRLAYGGMIAAGLVISLTVWQAVFTPPVPSSELMIISSAHTDIPDGTLMVYSPPEHDMTVVWVFDQDD